MKRIAIPTFLNDLYRDLRHRRLLPLVAVLAVAILATPFVLRHDGGDKGPDAGGKPNAAAGPPSSLTVVADNPGLRDYRMRLRGDQAKDPFEQHFSAPKSDSSQARGASGSGSGSGGSGGSEGGSATDGGTTGAGSGGTGSEVPSDQGGSGGAPEGGGNPPDTNPPDNGGGEKEPAYVMAIRLGPPDDMKLRELSAPEPLPGPENPIVVFRGLSSNGHKAVFRVAPRVSAIFGDAKCLEGSDRCEMVEIEPGLPVNFVYGADDKVFRLTVVSIQHNH